MYPDTATLVAASSVEELIGLTAPQQDALRAAAIASVERFTHQSFEPEGTLLAPVTERIDGQGGKYIWLPKRLETLTGLAVEWSSLDATDVELNSRHSRLSIAPSAVPGNWYTRTIRDDAPPYFTSGTGTVSISGVWGWADTPSPVVEAIRMDMEDSALAGANVLGSTLRAYAKLGVEGVSEGPLNVTVGSAQSLSEPVLALLEDFVWEPAGQLV